MINKVTKLYNATGLSEEDVQNHLDLQNSDGWYLISVDCSLRGWYRFFWEKKI